MRAEILDAQGRVTTVGPAPKRVVADAILDRLVELCPGVALFLPDILANSGGVTATRWPATGSPAPSGGKVRSAAAALTTTDRRSARMLRRHLKRCGELACLAEYLVITMGWALIQC